MDTDSLIFFMWRFPDGEGRGGLWFWCRRGHTQPRSESARWEAVAPGRHRRRVVRPGRSRV